MGRPAADQRQQQPPAHGAFIPAGRSCSPDVTLRGRAGELVGLLDKQMAKDWPKSFLKVTADGCYCQKAWILLFKQGSICNKSARGWPVSRLLSRGAVLSIHLTHRGFSSL